ncbi:MAG: hypothetical protein EA356_17970 [Geminicoccaceae bacterium]|nr:MAG: hypothetical protein EA356_17970 [Geminicoccaceae bacterium]
MSDRIERIVATAAFMLAVLAWRERQKARDLLASQGATAEELARELRTLDAENSARIAEAIEALRLDLVAWR